MSDSPLVYVKAFVCECDCGWTVEKSDPEICWFCGSSGPHEVRSTCRADPKYMRLISDYSEDFLFSDVPVLDEE